MKLINTLLFSVLSIFIFSCDKVDDLKTVNIDTDVEHNASIVINTVSGNVEPTTAFNINEKIELQSNADFSQYGDDKIKSISIKSIKLVFSNYTGEATGELEGTISFNGIADLEADLQKFNVKDASDNQNEIAIPFTEGQLSDIANKLKSSESLEIIFDGTAYNAPMSFDMDYKVEVGAEIEIL